MFTNPRTGMRTIRAARETFAAVAFAGLTVATVLRCIDGRAGAIAGVILTVMALGVLSRYRVSWDETSIVCQTAFSSRRRSWADFSGAQRGTRAPGPVRFRSAFGAGPLSPSRALPAAASRSPGRACGQPQTLLMAGHTPPAGPREQRGSEAGKCGSAGLLSAGQRPATGGAADLARSNAMACR